MAIEIIKKTHNYRSWECQAFACFPGPEKEVRGLALFAHGHTSHKETVLGWATRLAQDGITAWALDLPGHYLGSFAEVESLGEFKSYAHQVFWSAISSCERSHSLLKKDIPFIIGGHSLGALMALKADEGLKNQKRPDLILCVGLGMPPKGKVHVFDSPFYQATLDIRAQLVSPPLSPKNVFPWIKEEKENLTITNQRIHLISGEDDVVVGKDGAKVMAEVLESLGNKVTYEIPRKLSHHEPSLAAPHIRKFLKDENII